MRHRKHTFKIGRTSAHRKSLLANLVSSLILEGRIRTTVTKAKEARRLAEKIITLGKRGSLHARRQAIAALKHPDVVRIVFDELAPRFKDRNGGYTRILRLGKRAGDAADICFLEFLTEPVASKSQAVESASEAVTEPVAVAEEPVAENASAPAVEEAAPEVDAEVSEFIADEAEETSEKTGA